MCSCEISPPAKFTFSRRFYPERITIICIICVSRYSKDVHRFKCQALLIVRLTHSKSTSKYSKWSSNSTTCTRSIHSCMASRCCGGTWCGCAVMRATGRSCRIKDIYSGSLPANRQSKPLMMALLPESPATIFVDKVLIVKESWRDWPWVLIWSLSRRSVAKRFEQWEHWNRWPARPTRPLTIHSSSWLSWKYQS